MTLQPPEEALVIQTLNHIIIDQSGNMLGVVLCGGQSSRMGSDKGLLKYQSSTWAKIAAEKLSSLELPVVISINKNQQEKYSTIFPAQSLIADDESLQIKGPLAAILSVHQKYPLEDMLILACDMLLMETDVLKKLLVQYNRRTSFDTFIYANDGKPEPLCGIYSSESLNKILLLYQTDQLPKHSMKYLLEQINTSAIPLPDTKKKCFQNFNTQTELNQL